MQSFNEYNEQLNLNGISDIRGNILGHFKSEALPIEDSIDNNEDDMDKLEIIFKKLVHQGKLSKQQLI